MAPEKVLVLAVPSVKVIPVKPKVPAPLKLPSVWLTVVISKVPLLIVRVLKLSAPDKVKIPVPVLVNPPVPDKTPEKIVLLADPSVKVIPVRDKLPTPLKSVIVWLLVVIAIVPPLIVNAPKLSAPDNVSVPAFCLVNPPVPVKSPEKAEFAAVPSVKVMPVRVKLPAPLKFVMV